MEKQLESKCTSQQMLSFDVTSWSVIAAMFAMRNCVFCRNVSFIAIFDFRSILLLGQMSSGIWYKTSPCSSLHVPRLLKF